MKQTILIAIILTALVGVIAYGIGSKSLEVNGLGNIYSGTTTTVSSSTLTTTAAVIFNSNPSAQFRSMTNRLGVDAWATCNSTSTGFLAGTGILLRPSTTINWIEGDGTMVCTDTVYGITGGGTTIIGTMER